MNDDQKLEKLKLEIKDFQRRRNLMKTLIIPIIPDYLENLQLHVLHSHVNIEKLMAEMIRVKVWIRVYEKDNPSPSFRLLDSLYSIVEWLPYRRKNGVLAKLEPSFRPLSKRINNLDLIRNEFAHNEPSDLLSKYHLNDGMGAQNILGVYKFIENLEDDMLKTGEKVKDYGLYVDFLKTLRPDTKETKPV